MDKAIKEEKGSRQSRERIDTFCARAVLCLFLFVLAWGPLVMGGRRPALFLAVQGATVVMLALWIVRFWVQRPFRLLCPPMCWLTLAFLIYALVRCHLVEVEYTGRQQWILVLVYGSLFFVALNNLNRRNSATFVSLTLFAVGLIESLFAVFQFATHYPFINWGLRKMDQYIDRGSGTFTNPNHLAGFLALTVPLALGYTIMSRFSATVKVVLGYCAVVMLAGIVVSVSRGGILASAIGLIVFCIVLLAHRDFWKPALVLLCILTVLGLAASTQFDLVQKRFDKLAFDKVGDERPFYWQAAWQLFERNNLWGIGPGHFDIEFPSVRPWEVQDRPTFVHNDYLNTLCDWGCAGFGLIAVACGALFWGSFQVWRTLRRPSNETGASFSDRTAFVVGASIGLMALMLHCLVEFDMQNPGVALAVITLMALLAGQWRFATERFWVDPGRLGKIILTVLLAVIMAYLSLQGVRKGREMYWQAQANKTAAQPDQCLAFAAKAAEAEPMDWEADKEVGEYLWKLSLDGGPESLNRLKEAEAWYARAMQLNPFDAYASVGCGMCLDRLDETEKATPYFEAALKDDPHNCYIALEIGRHCLELGEMDAAMRWFGYGALRRAATEVANAETQKLQQNMADPIYVAQAAILRSNKAQTLEKTPADPILAGPK